MPPRPIAGFEPTRRWAVRAAVLVVVLGLLAPAAASAVAYEPGRSSELQRGTIERPASGLTVVSVQGFHFENRSSTKKPARLVAFGPRGEPRWVYNGSNVGAVWFYDVDPLPDGNLLVTATNRSGTIVMALDPDTREPVWIEHLDLTDTHDVDRIDDHRLLIANMRNYRPDAGVNADRILVYNRTAGSIEWEWRFRDHYPELVDADTSPGVGGTRADDWTHVNDVDVIGPGRYLVSVRNFDQVIAVDRSSGEVTMRLGANDRHDVLNEQHNPVYLESDDGRPTVLVADSEADRVVEYERRGGRWVRTWTLSGRLSWPRDADRLPNGNTLVVDSLNHRVIEVTPSGEIVWEVYAPWGPYDAERVDLGDEATWADRPTAVDLRAPDEASLTGSAGLRPGTGDSLTFAQRLEATFAGTPLEAGAVWFARRWAHVTPWVYPVWMTGWDFLGVVAAAGVVLAWACAEAVVGRGRLVAGIRRRLP